MGELFAGVLLFFIPFAAHFHEASYPLFVVLTKESYMTTFQHVDLSKMDLDAPLTVGLFFQAFGQLWDEVLLPSLRREFATKEDLKEGLKTCATKKDLRELATEWREELRQTERRIHLAVHQKVGTFIEEQRVFNSACERDIHQIRGAVFGVADKGKKKYRA